jgi:hypothetical protein
VSDARLRRLAAAGLVVGAILGMAGTFAPASSLRGLAWGLDGVALVAAALLTIHHARLGHDLVAAGFLVFAIGEALIVSGAAMELAPSAASFGAGSGLWAAALAMISAPGVLPPLVKSVGLIASVLFSVVAVRIFAADPLTPLSVPLPLYAYPFLAATLLGWAWAHLTSGERREAASRDGI